MKLSNHPVILTVCIHTVLILGLIWLVISEPGPVSQTETMEALVLFIYVDFPISVLLYAIDTVLHPILNTKLAAMGLDYEFLMLSIGLTLLGGLQWGLIAWGCVRFKRWLRGRKKDAPGLP